MFVEKELTQLESFVKQAGVKAEEARKAKELAEWEKDLQRRENEARTKLDDAERMLRENSFIDRRQDQYEDSHVILTPELSTKKCHPAKKLGLVTNRFMRVSWLLLQGEGVGGGGGRDGEEHCGQVQGGVVGRDWAV